MSDHTAPLAEPRTTPISIRRAGRERAVGGVSPAPATPDTPRLSTEHFVNLMPVDEAMWRQAQQLLDDTGIDDCSYVVPGDPATGKPIRRHIVTPPGVEIVVRMTADGETIEVSNV